MGIFDKIKEPIFLKEDSSASLQLAALQELAKNSSGKLADRLDQEIKFLEAGIFGENTILYELRNSHIPMFVIHDLYLEFGDLTAQIDFMIFTRKHYFVVECKNLFGNIEITNTGDFIRTVTFGCTTKREGLYSPITQNRRHLELIKQIRSAEKGNILTKTIFENDFYNNYRSIVVLANPKAILNAKYAPKDVREQVIRADQLAAFIRKADSDPKSVESSEKLMESVARFFLGTHKPMKTDYTAKFRAQIETEEDPKHVASSKPEADEKPETDSRPESDIKPEAYVKPEVDSASEKEQKPGTVVHSNSEKILCPKCGAEMIRRKANKGPNAGKEFYGCSNFPRCHSIISIQ